MRKINLLFLSLVMLSALVPSAGVSEQLMVTGEGELDLVRDGEKTRVQGEYRVANRGARRLVRVFPEFLLGASTWVEAGHSLDPAAEQKWTIASEIEKNKLNCTEDLSCVGLSLPESGIIPLRILNHYQDPSGYRYTAPSVMELAIGELDSTELSRLYLVPFQVQFTLAESDSIAKGKIRFVHAKNKAEQQGGENTLSGEGDNPLRIAVSLHAPRELKVLTAPSVIDLSPGDDKVVPCEVQNISGLPGSNYAVYAVFQWQDGPYRNAYHIAAQLPIVSAKKTNILFWGGVGILILLGILLMVVGAISLLRRKAKVKT